MLSAERLRVRLGRAEVVRGIDVSIDAGESVAIVGPNGSGKSTLVRTLAGMISPSGGRATLEGRAVSSLHARDRARLIGLLAQSAPVPELTTVEEHVRLGRHAHRGLLARWTSADAEAVADAMGACAVTHLASRRVENLSGGERQRVRLATMLAQNPATMLLDEPLDGLDVEHQLALLRLVQDIGTDRYRTVVCVLHDLGLALRYFGRVLVLHSGTLVADGDPRVVLEPGLLKRVFGVEARVVEGPGGVPLIAYAPNGFDSIGWGGASDMPEGRLGATAAGRPGGPDPSITNRPHRESGPC